MFSATYEDVRFHSTDGTALSGWYVPANNSKRTLILLHGMCANRSQMLPWAEWLRKAGYNLLLFDFRALGESDGNLCTMGLREPDDVAAAVEYLLTRPDSDGVQIGLFGFSMGGVSAMIAAARDERIKLVVSHGAYADLDRAIQQRCRKHFGPLAPVVETLSRRLGERWFPVPSGDVSALAEVNKIAPRPFLLVNGIHDNIVLIQNANDLHAASPGSELMILQNSGHAYPFGVDEAGYRELVLGFLESGFEGVIPSPAGEGQG